LADLIDNHFLKRPNHSKVRLWLMHESPKACFNISKVSLPILPNLTQNLMHTLCSSTSAIPPISENHRRLMQYTHKNTCNNQTLPHPTTPLGTLTHKTPPQHTLAGNSWTTSDLRVMSIVLGLWDTLSYNKSHYVLVLICSGAQAKFHEISTVNSNVSRKHPHTHAHTHTHTQPRWCYHIHTSFFF
jgi:hypothetical protein